MHRFVRNLITEWRRLGLPFKDETIVVAVSGGADSMSLLLAIDDLRKRKKLDLRVVAAHFDHKLRPDSFSDLDFVAMFARERGFELARGEWQKPSDGNLEQSARDARYEFLRKTAENLNASSILTAHTMNDQAETFLMNLIRGSGPDGLGGMRPRRLLEGEKEDEVDAQSPLLPFSSDPVSLFRPLLNWAKRRDTENFCLENSIDFRLDPMNEDMNFRRVWVRKALIPMLEEANPKIVETLCRTAELLRSGGSESELSTESENPHQPATGDLDLKHLKTLEKAVLFPVLRDWIRLRRGSLRGISQKHVEAIHDLIHSQKSGRFCEIPSGSVVKQNGRLSWRAKTGEKG